MVRYTLRFLRHKGYNLKYILLIGGGRTAQEFIEKVQKNPNYGYRFYGCIADSSTLGEVSGIKVLGTPASLGGHLDSGHVDEVVVAIELCEYEKLPYIISTCEKSGIKINVVPSYFQYLPSHPLLDEFDGVPVMTLRKIPLHNPFNAFIKRTSDILISLFCLLFFSPLMLAVSLVIYATMHESPIYAQERLGLNCKPFIMYKFRSMRSEDDSRPGWTRKKDARRTRFGTLIRKVSIDELPQFYNVLRGEMSVVGPRPEIKCYASQFKETIPRYMVKHQVKPGITGWAQVNGLRGDTSIEKRIRSDLYYIENWSFLLDLRIIFRTIGRAFYNENE